MLQRRFGRILVLALGACAGERETGTAISALETSLSGRYAVVANLENSAFLGVWDASRPGAYDNGQAFEVASYSSVFVRADTLIVTQNQRSDEILRFMLQPDGTLAQSGSFSAPAQSSPADVSFVAEDEAYVSLPYAGQMLVFNPTTLSTEPAIDFTGPTYAISEAGAGDLNPEPWAFAMRDDRIYVTLAQNKNAFLSHAGMHLAILDPNARSIERAVSETSSGLAQSGGNVDRVYVDERDDVYVYGGGSYGFDPNQSHGFLRIRSGETDFDPSYVFDVGALALDVPGGRIDYLNHLIYAGEGLVYATGNVPALASNPPDYVNDHTMQPIELNLYERTARVLPLPPSNGFSGAVAIEGDVLLAALAAVEGIGIFSYNLQSGAASAAPIVPTQGYVSQLVPLAPR